MIITLAGHVDHGKTSLVKALTGVDTDRLAEEKRRGLTIDLGFAYLDLDGHRIGFVDVPGHHRFIHNMVAGVAANQYALLVIAADDGVMPQSREHLQILSLLGVQRGVVALNKVDRVDTERVDEVREDIRRLVDGTFLATGSIVPVSATESVGIDELRANLAAAARAEETKREAQPFRLAVDRSFNVRGAGLVVTGTVISGSVERDATVVLARDAQTARVRGLHVQDAEAQSAGMGDRTAINLAGVDHAERGDWILAPESLEPTYHLTIRLNVLNDFPRSVKHRAPVHVYHATSHAQARLLSIDDADIGPGQSGIIDVALDGPLYAKVGDRLIVRDHDLERTLGGGTVVDLGTAPARRRADARRARLAVLDEARPEESLAALTSLVPVHLDDFARRWNRHPSFFADVPGELVGAWRFDTALLADYEKELKQRVGHELGNDPSLDGVAATALVPGRTEHPDAWLAVLARLVDRGELRVSNGRYALPDHHVDIPADVTRLFDQVEPLLDDSQPPSLGDMAKRLKQPFRDFERAMRGLSAHNLAIRISDTRYYLPERLLGLAHQAAELGQRGPFSVRDFRDATSIGRNVVIEILEYFDRKRFTRRDDNVRHVVGEPSSVVE